MGAVGSIDGGGGGGATGSQMAAYSVGATGSRSMAHRTRPVLPTSVVECSVRTPLSLHRPSAVSQAQQCASSSHELPPWPAVHRHLPLWQTPRPNGAPQKSNSEQSPLP